MTVAEIISELRKRSADARMPGKRERRMPRWMRGALEFVVVALLLGTYGFAGWLLWQMWTTGEWGEQTLVNFIEVAVAVGTAHSLLARAFPAAKKPTSDPGEAGQALRLIAAAGDDVLAPPVELSSATTAGIFDADISVTTTSPPNSPALRWILIAIVLVLPLMGVGSLVLAGVIWTIPPGPDTDTQSLPYALAVVTIFLVGIGAGLIGLGVYFVRSAVRMLDNPLVRGDALGLHQQTLRGQPDATIEWGIVRSFFQITDALSSLGTGWPRTTLFALDSGDQLIAWTVAPRATEEQRAANERLCLLIAERTHMPLRDLTKGAEELTKPRIMRKLARGTIILDEVPMNLAARRRAEFVAGMSGQVAVAERTSWLGQARASIGAGRAAYEATAGHEVPRAGGIGRVKAPWWRRALFVASVIIFVSLFPGSWALHKVEVWYYGRFASQIAVSRPLYTDTLTHDDGQWYTHALSDNESEFIFAGGTYLIQSDAQGDGGQAYAPGTYGDIAVEVTVRERPTNWNATMGSLSTAGVMVHGSDGSRVTCGASPIGTWFLMRYSSSLSEDDQWRVLAFGQEDQDVHWGIGVTNTFMLVARGTHYWCYANGHLLGFATDSIALQPGNVGVYLDDDTIYATFNDFRVYAVPAGM